tara:strand:+ start:173 stop:520 length:348 start_codon:yes stop_codon:yes gene_type:complete
MNKATNFEINLIKLFRGELPLYKSYWIYLVFGNFLITLPLYMLSKNTINIFIFTFSLYLVIKFIYYFTCCIGVWRSSQNYKGEKIFSFLARLAVVISLSTNIFYFRNFIAIIYNI